MKVNSKTYDNFTWHDCEQANLKNLKDLKLTSKIPEYFLEDSIQHGHLPKYERQGNYELIILRAYSKVKQEDIVSISQMSNKIAFIIYDKTLISIHRKPFEFLKTINQNFESLEELLLYIIKKMIQSFENPLNMHSKTIDIMEKALLVKASDDFSIEKLYYIKSKARMHKKIVQISQNVLNQVALKNSGYKIELQDIKDTTLNLLITADEIIEDTQALLSSYLSITAQKNNDVIKLLTIFSVFFLPLTFIAGIYGMNFQYMPELEYKYAYFIVLIVMIAISFGIWLWFKKKNIF